MSVEQARQSAERMVETQQVLQQATCCVCKLASAVREQQRLTERLRRQCESIVTVILDHAKSIACAEGRDELAACAQEILSHYGSGEENEPNRKSDPVPYCVHTTDGDDSV